MVEKGWVGAENLTQGDVLVLKEGNVEVVALAREQRKTAVYNLTVANAHNYFVGQDGGLVHNVTCRVGTPREGVEEIEIRNLTPLHPVPRPGMPENHIPNIAKSIKENGYLLENAIPIFRLPDGQLIIAGGHHRVAAMKSLGESTIPGRVVDWTSLSTKAQARWKTRFPNVLERY